MSFESELQERSAAIEQQAQLLESCADPATRAAALELVRSVMELHHSALERMLSVIEKQGESGADALDACARDPLIHSVLVLHDLHPHSLEIRVARALEELQPKLKRHSADATLAGIFDGVVRVSLEAAPQCGSTLESVKTMLEQALIDAAPDAEIVVESPERPGNNFISIDALRPAAQIP